jgi:putative oxidoreductase
VKTLTLIARILLGLVFVVFGLNGFLAFLPGKLPGGMPGEFLGDLLRSHYVYLVSGTQLVAGALLLIDWFTPLALALLGPVLANIVTFHLTMQRFGAGPAVVVTVLWLFLVLRYRSYFASLFTWRAAAK